MIFKADLVGAPIVKLCMLKNQQLFATLKNKPRLKNIIFYVTFDKIYSTICELCDIYFSCKNISVLNLNIKC